MARGGRGGRGGGSSRGGGRGGSRGGGSGASFRNSTSDLYSGRHKKIFNGGDDDDDEFDNDDNYGGEADDFNLDNVVANVSSLRSAGDYGAAHAGRMGARDADERAMAALQKKIDRKDQRKKAKTEAKEQRIAQAQAWAEQCRRKREERERQRKAEAVKLQLEKEQQKQQQQQQANKKQELNKKQQQQQQASQKKPAVAANPVAKQKSVSFATSEAPAAAPIPAAGSYVPPALRAKVQQQQQQAKQPQAVHDDADTATPAAATTAAATTNLSQRYVVPSTSQRAVSAALTARVHRVMNKLVLENAAALTTELINAVFNDPSFSRNDVITAVGNAIVASSIGAAHLTTRQAVAIAIVVRALQLKCGADVGAALVSRVATELRAAMHLGPDNAELHTNKFLEETERKGSHGAVMLACLTHLSCCSAKLPLSFLADSTALLREIAEQDGGNGNNKASFMNVTTCVASSCLQMLRVVGDALYELVPQQLNQWINDLESQLLKEKSTNSNQMNSNNNNNGKKSTPGTTIKFASVRLEVVLALAKQYVGGGAAGSRRQRAAAAAATGVKESGSGSGEKESALVARAPDEATMGLALDALADVVRPGAAAQDRRAWKRSVPTLGVPDLLWDVASQPELQGPRWWEKGSAATATATANSQQTSAAATAAGLLWEQENEAKLKGVERRELNSVATAVNEDDENDDQDQQQQHDDDEDDQDQEDDDDDFDLDDAQRERKLRQIKQLRTFENAASGQRFASERQRKVLQILDSAFDDGEACQRLMLHVQQNETSDVAMVMIQCCMQEATFNPFYSKIACRLLAPSMPKKLLARTRKAFQFALWDKFGSLRIAQHGTVPDIAALVNLACFVVQLFADDRFNLSLLRGLDIDISLPAPVSLFLRIVILRCLLVLDFPAQIVTLFFGHHTHKKGGPATARNNDSDVEDDGEGNVQSVLGANSVIKERMRKALLQFIDAQFVNEAAAAQWMVALLDVVAGNSLSEEELAMIVEELPQRIKTARKAVKEGGE